MWEDETIDYGCENGSLVLNRKKGVQYATYKCQDDGTYATPKGKEEGDPWPEYTLKPVDPCEYYSLLDNAPNYLVGCVIQKRFILLFFSLRFLT